MESEKNNLFRTILVHEDVNLAASRRRYQKLIVVFRCFFFFLTIIIGALIIFLVQDIASDSNRSVPSNNSTDRIFYNTIISNESQSFDAFSLQKAAEELEDVASLILVKYLGSNIDNINTELSLMNCRRSIQNGSGQIRHALEVCRVSGTLSDEKRKEIMKNRIIHAGESIQACLDDLEKVESTAASEVRAKVLQAKVYLGSWGDFRPSHDENIWRKFSIVATWDMILDNLFIVCLGGLQLSFIVYLLWAACKFS